MTILNTEVTKVQFLTYWSGVGHRPKVEKEKSEGGERTYMGDMQLGIPSGLLLQN